MRLIFEYIYITQISVLYAYRGFSASFDGGRCVLSWLMLYSLLPFAVRFVKRKCFSGLVLYLVFLLSFVPATIAVCYINLPFAGYLYLYYALLFGLSSPTRARLAEGTHHYMTKGTLYTLAGLSTFVVLFIWIHYAKGRIQLGLFSVYSARLEARQYDIPALLRYVNASLRIVLPVLAGWALLNKNYTMAAWFCAIQLVSFFVDGAKTTLFSLVVSILGALSLAKHEERIALIPHTLSGVGLLAILEYSLWHSYLITGLFIRRVMFVPQILNVYYYRFFSENEPDYFRSSFFRFLGYESPYGPIAKMIGRIIGSEDLAANNGLFSDAMANLGIVGIFIMPIAILLLLKAMDVASKDLGVEALIGAAVAFTPELISTFYSTLFLTHGAVALILVFYFMPRMKKPESIGFPLDSNGFPLGRVE